MIYIHNIEIDKYICIHIFTFFAHIYMHRDIYINVSLRKKCPYLGLFWFTFSRIWTRYGISLRIQSVCGKMQTRITPNTDTFHAAYYI